MPFVERGLADPQRLAVMGLSYGGFLTQWLIGVTDRFAAAASENGVPNQVSTWANSYFGVHYNRRAGLGDPLTDKGMRSLWRSSPLRNAAQVTTPLLMLQAEEDRICPAADNEQLFTALKVLGREVELILYPDEHHEMKNSGRPDRRIDRMERILAWFERPPAATGARADRYGAGDFRLSRSASPPTVSARPSARMPMAAINRNASPPKAVAKTR